MTVLRLMLTVVVGALISSGSVFAQASSPAGVVPDAEIQKILAERKCLLPAQGISSTRS